MLSGGGEDFGAGQVCRPGFHQGVRLGHVLHPRGVGGEALVRGQVFSAHGAGQAAPMLLVGADDGEPAVLAGVDIVGRDREAAVAIAGAPQGPVGVVVDHAEVRGEGREHGLDHRHFDHPPTTGPLALVEGGDDGPVEVRARQEIGDRRTGLHRRAVREAGDADRAGRRLDGDVHGQVVALGTGEAVAGRRGVDQPRVQRHQHVGADAQLVHHARREILQQHVSLADQRLQQLDSARVLQVQRHRALVGVQHRQRQRRPAAHRLARPQWLPVRRLDLDHPGPGLGHQQAGVRTLVDLAQVDDRDPGQRRRTLLHG